MADTGNTATIAFASTGITGSWEELDIGEETRDAIEDTHLTSTKRTYMPGDLANPETMTGRIQWDQSFGTFPRTSSTPETVTVTFPLKSGQTTNGTFAGTGLITRVKGPTIANGQKMMGEITVQFDGKTGPTYTAGS